MDGSRWLALTLVVLTAQPVMAQKQVTLRDAIALAEKVQPRIVQAQGQLRSIGAQTRAVKGSFLPSLTFNASGSSNFSESQRVDNTTGEFVTGGSRSNSMSTSLSSSVTLFDGFRRSNDLGAARANDDAARADLVDARYQQALQTTNQFFDALAARRLLTVREASVLRAEEQLKTSVARLAAGSATRSDSLRSLVGLGNAQLQLLNVQAQLATAEANLGRLVGETERVQALDDSSFYETVRNLDEAALRQEAVGRSPQVQAAEASARAAEAGLRASRSSYYPSLSLSGSYSLNGRAGDDFSLLSQNQLSLRVNWPLFNGFSREQGVVVQTVAAENARAQLGESRRLIVANLTGRLADLETAGLRIEITERSVLAAQEDLRVQQERYRLGASTILDVVTTQEALTQAEVDAVTARFDYLRAKAAIEALIGRPL
jgi:outer membrane protein TolC